MTDGISQSPTGAITIEGPKAIEMFQLLRLRWALKLEIFGLRHSQGSVYAYVKRTYNLKGNKQRVLDQLNDIIAVKEAEWKTAHANDSQ